MSIDIGDALDTSGNTRDGVIWPTYPAGVANIMSTLRHMSKVVLSTYICVIVSGERDTSTGTCLYIPFCMVFDACEGTVGTVRMVEYTSFDVPVVIPLGTS
jgi:hypothetical protein